MALLSDPTLDIRQYLEDLVRIAVGSAHQAESMSRQVRAANKKARRSLAIAASLGVLGLVTSIAGYTVSRSANVRLSEVRDEVSTLQNKGQDIASLNLERKGEEATRAHQKAEDQAAREAQQHQNVDLQQQANFVPEQVSRQLYNLEAAGAEGAKLGQNIEKPQPAQETSAADQGGARQALQHQTAHLPQPATSSLDQVASRSDALKALSTSTHKQSHSEPTRAQAEMFQQDMDEAQQQRKAEQATFASKKIHEQQMAAHAPRGPSAPPPNLIQPLPVFMPRSSTSQQLLTARQWLVSGRLNEARRTLAMVQTQMVLQPVEPGQAAAQRVNALATNVGDAIRWLDTGANGQAVQALNQAMYSAGSN